MEDVMRDSSHSDQIERWARYVKSHPDWKKIHTSFIDAQFEKASSFIEKLAQTKEGQEKLVLLYKIKNVNGYPRLLDTLQEN